MKVFDLCYIYQQVNGWFILLDMGVGYYVDFLFYNLIVVFIFLLNKNLCFFVQGKIGR